MPVGERKQYRDSIISPYPQVNFNYLMGLGSYFELCQIFQRFPNSARQHCGKCNLLSESSGTLPPLRRTSYSTYPPSCALSPHRLYGDASEGLFISVRVIEVERLISAVSTPITTRSFGNSSRTPQLTLQSKPLPYNTVSLRLVSCFWLGVLKTRKAEPL